MPQHALDRYYLAFTLLVTTGYQLLGFAIAYTFQFDKITDLTGGSNFFLLALLTLLCGHTFHARNVVASVLAMVWAARLAGFLFFRVLMTGHDGRFDEIRRHFFKFLVFWIAQIIWVWTVSLPFVILNSPAISDTAHGGSNPPFGTSRDVAGVIIWSLGFIIEAVADVQKYRFKSSQAAPKDRPMNSGLWAWSRHPPYFGEMMCWWGMWILCLSPTTNGTLSTPSRAAQNAAVLSPLFTFVVLMFGSGLPSSAKPQARRFYLKAYGSSAGPGDTQIWDNYQRYLERTSILVPVPPSLYKRLPAFAKKTVLFDFPMYQFNVERDGPPAIEEEQRRAA